MKEHDAIPYSLPDLTDEERIERASAFRDKIKQRRTCRFFSDEPIPREVIEAAAILAENYGVSSDIWSATSFTELRRDGEAVERANRLNPGRNDQSWVEQSMAGREGPAIAATDYVRAFAEQIRPWVPQERYVVLAVRRGSRIEPMSMGYRAREGDIASVAIYEPDRAEALRALDAAGWEALPEAAAA